MEKLPSAFQPGDKVGLQMLIDLMGEARDAKVNAVNFSNSKVRYNIEIPIGDGYFRLANIDSAFLHPPVDNEFQHNDKVAIEARRQHEQHESTGTLLSDHFSTFICKQLKHSFGVDTVEQAKSLQDFELMRVQGLGKMFIQKLRNL
jgi:hypothetical protein